LKVAPRLHAGGGGSIGWIPAKAADIYLFGVCQRVQANDPSPRLNRIVPDPEGEIAAAWEIRLLIDKIILLLGNIGMSAVDAATVGSEPNLIYARAVVVLVTTIESPPPDRGAFAETLPTDTLIVPVGRNGLTEPNGMTIVLF
jgi:hypothetical protein